MAVTVSAFGAHVIRSLDDMLRSRLHRASPELRSDADKLRSKLGEVLRYSVDAENRVLEEDLARQWLAELRQLLYRADQLLEAHGADAQPERPSILAPIRDGVWPCGSLFGNSFDSCLRLLLCLVLLLQLQRKAAVQQVAERCAKFSFWCRNNIMRRFSTDKYIKQEIRALLQRTVSIAENRPEMLEEKNMKEDPPDKSRNGRELMGHDNLVGTDIELEMPTLVNKLTEDHDPSRHFLLFAIFGLGGVGKKTMARKIFDDQRTRSAFSTRIWVSISQGSTATQLLLATTCAAAGDLKGSKTVNELQKLLADKIRGRRIFLVFNIHSDEPSIEGIGNAGLYGNLIEILRFFHAAAEGCRVLITTSDENVGNEIKSAQIQKGAELYGVQVHRLRQLMVEDGWMLLLKACLEQSKITPDLKKIGIGIVQKCNGIPLAIKAVGGVLARKSYRPEEWEGIHNSRAFSLKDPTTGTEGGVRSSIYLSYQNAVPHLKQCFLYLSLFPMDFEIKQHIITQLWISEGLIDSRRGHSVEETVDGQNNVWQEGSNRQNSSEGIAQELGQDISLSRDTSERRNHASSEVNMDEDNIISPEPAREHNTCSSQEILEDHNRQPPQGTPCLSSGHSSNERISKQHNFSVEEIADRYFRELAEKSLLQQDSRTKGYKLPQQVRKIAVSLTENEVCAGDPKDLARLPATLHRLSFLNKGLTTIPEDIGRLRSLRTLLLSGNPLGEKGLDIIFKNLEFLRVLDLSDTEINSIPKTLGNMVHLRHLNLSHTRIQALPESIGSLRKLRFLDLHGCECLTSLPKNIQKLSKLEYLNLQHSEIKEPPSLQNLMLLTFLHGFVADNISSCGWPLKELENMNKLSNLQIKLRKTLGKTVARGEVLKKKDNLRNLELSYCTVNSENLSEEESKRLKTMFNQLHPHQCLESLKVEGYYGSTYPEWLSSSKLPNLQQLSLVNCKFCERLPPICELQNLKFLRIANISKLQAIDMRPQAEMPSFPSLEELHIEDMQDLEYWSAFEAGDLPLLRTFSLQRCPKLKHLPGGLEHCKMLATMELTEAEQLQVIGNLLVQELLVVGMQSLTKGVDATWLRREVKGKQVRADGPWAEKGEQWGLAPMYHARPRVINMVCKKSKSAWRRNGAKTVSGKVKATSGSRKRGGPGAEPKYLEATRAEDEARTRVCVKGVAWRLRGAVRSGG
ncbi:hypothetical protein ACP70R_039271 [Stipagrostis hirtigluma subsp. patula]